MRSDDVINKKFDVIKNQIFMHQSKALVAFYPNMQMSFEFVGNICKQDTKINKN